MGDSPLVKRRKSVKNKRLKPSIFEGSPIERQLK